MTDPKHPDNKGKIPTKAITGNPPHADKAGFRKSYCDAPKTKSVSVSYTHLTLPTILLV